MRPDDAARRTYWGEQFESAYAFMRRVMEYPVVECGEPMVPMVEAAEEAGVEVLFSERPHALGLSRIFYLRAGLIEGFVGAAREMNRRGWVMRVEDGFRTVAMQKHLSRRPEVFDAILRSVVWELGGQVPSLEFFMRRSMTLVAQYPKVGTHMSGSAIDISVLERDGRGEVDRGGPYLEMSELTPMGSPFVSAAAQANRREITGIMRRHGFVEYPWEFWHYNGGDAFEQVLLETGRPGRYGAVEWSGPETNVVTPLADPLGALNDLEEMRGELEAALRRRGEG